MKGYIKMTSASAIQPGAHLYHWLIISVDGRRVTARCRCHEMRTIAIEDLQNGIRTSCGCLPPSSPTNRALREAREEHRRRRAFDWSPENGR